jgi:hypothetical protein
MVAGTVLIQKAVPKTLSEFMFQFSFFYHWSIFSSEQINKSRNKLLEEGSVRVFKISREVFPKRHAETFSFFHKKAAKKL